MKRLVLACCVSSILVGCVSPYEYKSTSADDPTLSVGGRVKENAPSSQGINININGDNKCSNYQNGGMIGMFGSDELILTVPANKEVQFAVIVGARTGHCQLGPYSFVAEPSKKYSFDTEIIHSKVRNYCKGTLVEVVSVDSYENVKPVELKKIGFCE